MPSKKPRLMTYTNQNTINKFYYISELEKRSASKELEYIVEEYIKNFESINGEIIVGEDESITIAKPTLVRKDKSSNSKTG
ncbi:MAG: hypothetical protein WCD89_24895 [Anaerocolumna sp.]